MTWSSILKVLKVTSLQCPCNSSKKKLGMEFIFCIQIKMKVSTSWHNCFWRKWHVQSTHKKKLVIFVPYVKKKCYNCFYVLLWCKTFRYFTVVSHVCCNLFLPRSMEWVLRIPMDIIGMDIIIVKFHLITRSCFTSLVQVNYAKKKGIFSFF